MNKHVACNVVERPRNKKRFVSISRLMIHIWSVQWIRKNKQHHKSRKCSIKMLQVTTMTISWSNNKYVLFASWICIQHNLLVYMFHATHYILQTSVQYTSYQRAVTSNYLTTCYNSKCQSSKAGNLASDGLSMSTRKYIVPAKPEKIHRIIKPTHEQQAGWQISMQMWM